MTENTTPLDNSGNAEAAKYRTRLREVEQERDTLKDQLFSIQKNQVEEQAKKDGLKPAAIWAAGIDLDDLLTEDGVPDANKVAEGIKQARETLGIPPRPKSATAWSGGDRGEDIPVADEEATWGKVLNR